MLFMEEIVMKTLSDVNNYTDLMISGHLHDGYLPKCLDWAFENTEFGLFLTPLLPPFPGVLCRGLHKYRRGYIFVSQGYRKYIADMKLFNTLEKITANNVEILKIKPYRNIKTNIEEK